MTSFNRPRTEFPSEKAKFYLEFRRITMCISYKLQPLNSIQDVRPMTTSYPPLYNLSLVTFTTAVQHNFQQIIHEKMSTLASQASSGFSNASNYDSHRPTYSPDVVQKLLIHIGVANKPNARIIDIGSGTGKFTELLVARPEYVSFHDTDDNEWLKSEMRERKSNC